MELLKDRVNKVYFDGEGTSSVTSVSVSIDGADPVVLPVSRVASSSTHADYDLYYATVPYMNEEGTITATWSFTVPTLGNYTHTDVYEVVTPLLTVREVKRIVPSATTEEALELEAAVRHIIQAHCGQSFGHRTKTLTVLGDGSNSLRLPERLVSVTNVTDPYYTYAANSFLIKGDGWFLKKVAHWYDTEVQVTNPIHHPYSGSAYTYKKDINYTINGTWGWDSVPEPIAEAARILVQDYSCMESQYRDKFIKTMTAADWRFEFNAGAYAKTGNVRADQLLDAFIVPGWLIV